LFYVLVAVGTIGGTVFSLVGVNPIRLLVMVAVINGVAAAPFLVALMLVSSDRNITGEHRNGRLATTVGWLTVGLMTSPQSPCSRPAAADPSGGVQPMGWCRAILPTGCNLRIRNSGPRPPDRPG
jgi:hypothetical protein